MLTIDFETYYDHEYTLKKMTTEAYIRDPRFCAHVLVVKPQGQPPIIFSGNDIARGIRSIDWNQPVVAHHAHFDGLILSHHYGVQPAVWFDTLSMANLLAPIGVSKALKSLAAHYELGEKTVPYSDMIGVTWENTSAAVRQAVIEGCVQDVALTEALALQFLKAMPKHEWKIIDETVRMFTRPLLIGDEPRLRQIGREEFERKGDAMIALGVTAGMLASSAKFSELLIAEGVEVETKSGANGPIPALAATDPFMVELASHINPRVRALAQARLDAKSTLAEARAVRMADMASRGPMPVYLHYCGAHTTRWSGGDKVNFQNLPRKGGLRECLSAPKGYKLVVADASQIECRILNAWAGQDNIVRAFAEGRDLYCEGASRFYGRPIDKRNNPAERQLGKVLELASGYGMGADKFLATCAAGPMGSEPIILSKEESALAIRTYRQSHDRVVKRWYEGDDVLKRLARGQSYDWGAVKVEKGGIRLPNDALIQYEITPDNMGDGWRKKTKYGSVRVWGGTLVENVVQALARVVISETMLAMRAATTLSLVLSTHDELVYLAPERYADDVLALLIKFMSAKRVWLPNAPLAAEGAVMEIYGK